MSLFAFPAINIPYFVSMTARAIQPTQPNQNQNQNQTPQKAKTKPG